MISKKIVLTYIIGLGFLILTASQLPAFSMSPNHPNSTAQFRPIEQPLSLKILVTLGGLGLISLELWWFLFSQPKSK